MVKLNLGCGTSIATGWINIDSSLNIVLSKHKHLKTTLLKTGLLNENIAVDWPKGIMRRNLTKPLPFTSGSIDYIYSSHFLEHLDKKGAFAFLGECQRVLKTKGVLRVVVPDLKKLALKYSQNIIDADTFMENLCITENSRSFLFSRFTFKDMHRWMYDFNSLRETLLQSGFSVVTLRSFKLGVVPDVELLDNRCDESLFVEAEK